MYARRIYEQIERRTSLKQPRKLTRTEKGQVSNVPLPAKDWMLVEDLGAYLKIIHKATGKTRTVAKNHKKLKRG